MTPERLAELIRRGTMMYHGGGGGGVRVCNKLCDLINSLAEAEATGPRNTGKPDYVPPTWAPTEAEAKFLQDLWRALCPLAETTEHDPVNDPYDVRAYGLPTDDDWPKIKGQ